MFKMRINRIVLVILSVCITGLLLFIVSNMEPDNFYMHLPSNVERTSPLQSSNTIGNYVTRLATRLNLSDEWEVALTVISYKKSWENIFEDEIIKLVDMQGEEYESLRKLRAAHYNTCKELVDEINDCLWSFKHYNKKIKEPPVIEYSELLNKVKILAGTVIKKAGNNETTSLLIPKFSSFLTELLGLNDNQGRALSFEHTEAQPYIINPIQSDTSLSISKSLNSKEIAVSKTISALPSVEQDFEASSLPQKEIIGFNLVDITAGINSLYIYTDIIKPVLVGDAEVKLIRRVRIPSNTTFCQTIEIEYLAPQYYPLSLHEIENIEITIRDSTGREIDFREGPVDITLHFRKKIRYGFESIYQLFR